MERYLKEQGVDMAQFKKRKLDADKVFALAQGLGMDPQRLVKEQMTMRIAPPVKEAMRNYLAEAYPAAPVMGDSSADHAGGRLELVQESATGNAQTQETLTHQQERGDEDEMPRMAA